MSKIPKSSDAMELFIRENGLILTDPRYSFGVDELVADVIEVDSISGTNDQFRRLLLVKLDESDQADTIWEAAEQSPKSYIAPKKIEELTDMTVYQIATSSRPFKHEAALSNPVRDSFDNSQVAMSLGSLLAEHYSRSGTLLDPNEIRERLMLIDFLGSDVEPVMIAPPLKSSEEGAWEDNEYINVFPDDDASGEILRKTFVEGINED